ncbi:MAG: type II toxin-antitoxin system RelE/ParE family toxin [Smithellaceae bacterium]|nr:type II toxin-antitoxin system RelE/ParE family toxin [Smithellaceae bacterium]
MRTPTTPRYSGQGKSKGYRTIILLRKGFRAFFVYGFAKNERDNIRKETFEKCHFEERK